MKRNLARRFLVFAVVSGIVACLAGPALAGGFLLFEQSVKGLGNAFAGGAAVAEDATTIFYNPAGITRLPGSQFEFGAHYIIPSAEFDNKGSTTSPLVGGAPLTGGDGDDAGVAAVVPHLYYAQEITDKFHAGIGINSPFGLETDYDKGWVGRYHALKSRLLTINFNPSLAFKVNDLMSVGAGFNAQYFDTKLTNAVDFGTIGAIGGAGTIPQTLDGLAQVQGDDWGFGYNFGFLVTPTDNFRLGFAYRSAIDFKVDGEADFSTPAPAIPLAVATGLVDTDAKADITLPATASLSAYWQIHRKWAIMGDIFWTQWSQLDEIRIELDTGPEVVTTLKWKDTLRYALGVSYFHDPQWTFRIGTAFDETPIPNARRRTPRIPGNDRIWATVGASYRFSERLGVDLAYAHLFVDDPEIRKSGTDPEDVTRGALRGDYDAGVNIVSAQVSWQF
ncbi:MAG: outer membrane protein transport protein [Desulfobacterales bacterium]|nr:MAG: outer membrane protein transport protein [Desulfobacterales bacterium]